MSRPKFSHRMDPCFNLAFHLPDRIAAAGLALLLGFAVGACESGGNNDLITLESDSEMTGKSSTGASSSTTSGSSSTSNTGDTSRGSSSGAHESGYMEGSTVGSGGSSDSTSGNTCEDLNTQLLTELCATMATQQTNVAAQGEGIDFSGAYAFFGVGSCGDCASLQTLMVYVFGSTPRDTRDLSQSLLPMLSFEVDAAQAAFETNVEFSHAETGRHAASDPTSVMVIATPSLADFEVASNDLPPRISVTLYSDDVDLQVSGTVDAVYCEGANFYIPCE
jgi:hypothetical protein